MSSIRSNICRINLLPILMVFLFLPVLLTGCTAPNLPPQTDLAPSMIITGPPSAPTNPSPFPLAGTWIGKAVNGSLEMNVIIKLQDSCLLGEDCGTYSLSLPCAGTFNLITEVGGVYEFHASNKTASCSGEGRDFLQLLPDGSLEYISRGDYGETKGILVRDDSPSSVKEEFAKVPVLFDDDGSPDGTSALLYLLTQSSVELTSVSISYGEAHPAIYIQHVGRLLDHYGFSAIPLGAGLDEPLAGNNGFPESLRETANAFWGWPIPNAGNTYPVMDSADLIISIVKQSPEPVTLFFSGPVTNLALALRKAPEIQSNITSLFLMGGAVYVRGNVHDFYPESANIYAEWNIFADPLAASEVFESGLTIYLVPLDATNQVFVSKTDTSQWRTGGEISDFAADIYDGLMNSTNRTDFYIWDLMTSEIMVDPSLCEFKPLHLGVVTDEGIHNGQTVVYSTGDPNINVCLKPNVALLKQALIDSFAGSQK